jgi:predicted transcriptional regulator
MSRKSNVSIVAVLVAQVVLIVLELVSVGVNGKQPLTILRSKPALPVMELAVSVAAIVTEQDGDEIYKPKYLAYFQAKICSRFVPCISFQLIHVHT